MKRGVAKINFLIKIGALMSLLVISKVTKIKVAPETYNYSPESSEFQEYLRNANLVEEIPTDTATHAYSNFTLE